MVSFLKTLLHKVTNIRNVLMMKFHGVRFGSNFRMKGIFKIYGKGENISIGDNFFGQSGIRYNPVGQGKPFVLQIIGNGKITIGNHVGMSNCTLCAQDHIMIGDYTNIGGGCIVNRHRLPLYDFRGAYFLP